MFSPVSTFTSYLTPLTKQKLFELDTMDNCLSSSLFPWRKIAIGFWLIHFPFVSVQTFRPKAQANSFSLESYKPIKLPFTFLMFLVCTQYHPSSSCNAQALQKYSLDKCWYSPYQIRRHSLQSSDCSHH